jgi:putative ABC transport system ATP-binding protein
MPLEVRLQRLCKRYRTGEEEIVALDDVSLDIEPGAVVAVTGPSGSGKSTLLHLVGAMDVADSGDIRVGDHDVAALSRSAQAGYRRQIGFVFQRFHLLPALTVLDNVTAPLLPYKTGFDKFEKARSLLAAVGLEERAQSLPSRLSGGQQQRVAIARALVNSPGLLLADEPTGNLDSKTGAEIMELLLELRGEHGMTVLVATHDQVIASRCDRIVRLKDGRVLDDVSVPRDVPPDLLNKVTRLNTGL